MGTPSIGFHELRSDATQGLPAAPMNPPHASVFQGRPEPTASGVELDTELKQLRDLVGGLSETNRQLQQALDESVRREQALRDSQSLYQALVDNLPVRVFHKDVEGRFIFCNRAFCDSLKRASDDVLGKA